MSGVEESSQKKLFDPEVAFFDLPIVRNTFGIACGVVVVSFILIALFTESKASLDMTGFNGFIEMFKFPLGSIAFFGGLFAFYATNHRSEQQKKAMELTQKSIDATGEQNRFANYYKHLEEFTKYVVSVSKEYDPFVKIRLKALHSNLFPTAVGGDYNISLIGPSLLNAAGELVRLTINDVQKISHELKVADKVEPGKGILKRQLEYQYLLHDYFVFTDLKPDGVFATENDDEGLMCQINLDEVECINKIYVMLKFLGDVAKFDAKIESPYTDFHDFYRNAFEPIRPASPISRHSLSDLL